MAWFTWLVLIAAVLVFATVGLTAFGALRWTDSTQALTARLEAGRVPAAPARYHAREIEGLPVPVQRYFRAALTPGQGKFSP